MVIAKGAFVNEVAAPENSTTVPGAPYFGVRPRDCALIPRPLGFESGHRVRDRKTHECRFGVNIWKGRFVLTDRSMQAAALMFEVARVADDAFDRVVREREEQLLRIAFRILGNWADAEEVAQDAFIRLHRHGLNFPNEMVLGAWLYRVAVNLSIDRGRRIRPAEELGEIGAKNLSAEAEMLRDEQKRLLLAALATLPAKERAAVILREIEGFSTIEVAAILSSTEGTVRSQISKAMVRLRARLEKGNG
jgi:RNA polymerase sigma-70 factor, ECF subfamily